MKVLITGAAGFIGSNLSDFLLKKNCEVWGVDNFITGQNENLKNLATHKSFHFYKGDITIFDFSNFPSFDIVFHLASPASPVQYKKHGVETMMTNALGTKRLLDFMRDSESKVFVMSSTSEVYGDPAVHPQKEDYFGNVNPVGERSVYDEGKRFAEALIMAYHRSFGLDTRIARIFNTYGPNMEKDDGRVITNFMSQSLSGAPITIFGDGKQTRSFCFISDMVEGLYLLGTISHLSGEIINLGNPDERTIMDVAKLVKKITGSQSEIVFKSISQDDPAKRRPDITKAKKLLSWEPQVGFEEGLKQTEKYFKERFFKNAD